MPDLQSKLDNTTCGIEKYEGTFDQDELGVTQIPTETILAIKNFTLLALYTFLASRPSTWRLNAKHLADHFDCNKDKIYKALGSLMEMGFLTRTQIKEKGRFVRCHYRLHLRQKVQTLPSLEKPDVEKPETENPDAYKTDIPLLESKEKDTTTHSSSSFTELEKELLSLRDKNIPHDEREPDEFLKQCHWHVYKGDRKYSIPQRINGLKKIIKKGCFETPGDYPKTKESQENADKLLWSAYQSYVNSPIEIGLRDKGIAVLMTFEQWKTKNA